MSTKKKKKERHKAKRDAKRAAARRQKSVSPVKRLAAAPGEVECWMSDGFGLLGQLQIFTYKRGAGIGGVACFLIDRGVVGLKDAWMRLNVDRSELQYMLKQTADRGIVMRPATVQDARRWIAGAVRWTHDNGMRLPRDWGKTASIIGGVGDWTSADVSAFVKEFAGHPNDLRQRLIGDSFENYARRKDIQFTFDETAPYMDQCTGEYENNGESDEDPTEEELQAIVEDVPVEELNAIVDGFTVAATALAAQTIEWLAAQDETGSPELLEAWRSIMVARLLSRTAMPDADEDEVADFGFELLCDISARVESSRAAEVHRAVGQVLNHLQSDPMLMRNAVLREGFDAE